MEKFFIKFISVWAIIVSCILCIGIFVSFNSDYTTEYVTSVSTDNIGIFILVLSVFLCLSYVKVNSKQFTSLSVFLVLSIGLLLSLTIDYTLTWDSSECMGIAEMLTGVDLNTILYVSEEDFYYRDGGYFRFYPHQSRLVLFWALLMRLGFSSIELFMLLHVVLMSLGFIVLADIVNKIGIINLSNGIFILFLVPFYLVSMFVYSDTIGLVLGIFAVRLFMSDKFSILHQVLGILCLSGTIFFRQSNLIIFLGLLLWFLIKSILSKSLDKKLFYICICFVVASVVGNFAVNYLERRLGFSFGKGLPWYQWIVLGLGFREPTITNELVDYRVGQYFNSELNVVFNSLNYDIDLFKNYCIDEFTKRWSNITESFSSFVEFWFRKLGTCWFIPDFGMYSHTASAKINKVWKVVYGGSAPVISLCNYIQSILYLGYFICAIDLLKRKTLSSLHFLFVFLIGGFIFSLIWEAKARYQLQWIFISLPCSIYGIQLLFERLKLCIVNIRST